MSILLPFPPAATITSELWILYYAPITAEVALRKARFKSTADKTVPYFQLAASTYKDKYTLSVRTYASGKSFDLLCSVVDNICSALENL